MSVLFVGRWWLMKTCIIFPTMILCAKIAGNGIREGKKEGFSGSMKMMGIRTKKDFYRLSGRVAGQTNRSKVRGVRMPERTEKTIKLRRFSAPLVLLAHKLPGRFGVLRAGTPF